MMVDNKKIVMILSFVWLLLKGLGNFASDS